MPIARKRVPAKAVATPDPWMSLRQAAAVLGCAPETVKTHALNQRVQTQTVAGRVFVSRESVERLKTELATAAEAAV